eukprot:SAG31_NODE_1698_length_7500_cov_3.644778_2_plen_136_part_00
MAAPVFDDDFEINDADDADGINRNDVAISMDGYGSPAEDEDDDVSTDQADTPDDQATHGQDEGDGERLGDLWKQDGGGKNHGGLHEREVTEEYLTAVRANTPKPKSLTWTQQAEDFVNSEFVDPIGIGALVPPNM